MKQLFYLFTVISLIAVMMTACNRKSGGKDAVGIKFENASYKQVLDKAKKMGKPIFVDMYASWCGPCKMMERTVFSDRKVGDFHNTNFINFRIDGEKGEGRDLVKKFGVQGYPTLLYINGDGKILRAEMGALGTQELMRIGKSVLEKTH